jgi:hypothetical protein
MRRDHFTVVSESLDPAGAERPTLDIQYDGPGETLTGQLTETGDDIVDAAHIDAAFRLQDDPDSDDAEGVFSLTHRITGEYLLECNAAVDAILSLVTAARDAAEDDGSYRIRIHREDGEPITFDLDALLVYGADGDLLRKRSLIPSGVEL